MDIINVWIFQLMMRTARKFRTDLGMPIESDELRAEVSELVDYLTDDAVGDWPVGTIVGRSRHDVVVRKLADVVVPLDD